MGATVTFDGAFLTITKSGLSAFASVNGTKMIPLASIAAVQVKQPGMFTNGFVQFTVPGGNESRARYGASGMAAAGDENSIIFTRKQAPAFEKLVSAVQDALRGLALRS